MKELGKLILKILGTPKDNCYIASEAYYHIMGGKLAGYKPVQGYYKYANPCKGEVSHWWLEKNGKVIDITAAQFDTPVDYSKGRGRGFLTKNPSKKAKELIDAIR